MYLRYFEIDSTHTRICFEEYCSFEALQILSLDFPFGKRQSLGELLTLDRSRSSSTLDIWHAHLSSA